MKLPEVEVTLWNKYNVRFIPNPNVNIIVGNNGSGKTTLLSEIEKSVLRRIEDKDLSIFIPSVDNLVVRDKRKKGTALSQDLDSYIYDMKSGPSLMYYRMSMLDSSYSFQTRIRERIENFCDIVNSLFRDSEKRIEIESNKFIIYSHGDTLSINDLSSGEKQVLLILLRIFLLEEKEAVVLIDEPENSLDISWQYRLIDLLIRLNPYAQFFITTHSPSIFSDGWGDRIFYMEDITTRIV
ncbi:MAG: AAA family ATPase [Duncaniella sp.]|nr:AAA family ATPase [Duncaniella sp.]